MLKKILYTLWISVFVLLVFFGLKNGSLLSFIGSMEDRTFDIRQRVIAKSNIRQHNKDIVIIAIDDASYEYILDNYGEWPVRRDIYARMVDFIEAQSPKSIAFDFMFVKSLKSSAQSDNALIKAFEKYDNLFTAMNLDDQPQDLRTPVKLPDALSVSLSGSENFEPLEYSNCRVILDGILNATSNIGLVNVARSDDGVLRKMPLFIKYQDNFYPQLGLKVANHYLGLDARKYSVKTNGDVILNDNENVFTPDRDGGVILNWYGPAGTFENISMYKVLKAVEGKEKFEYDFSNKVVYFGATASSLFDIKTVPVDKVYPGVEVQATYVNNIIDGSAIERCPEWVNVLFGLLLALLSVLCVVRISSMPVAICACLTIYAGYVILTYEMMRGLFDHYLWIKIVNPVGFALLAFVVTVVVKYLLKSRDFDQQYKLATTDGLTELYNHRYFQEQMSALVANAKRYETPLSLIIIDIDFFKKFNDLYGHQSGDAVLRQVAFELKKNVRSADIVCRYGGEEMSIILPNTKYKEAVGIANKLCSIIASKKCKLSNGRESNVTISLGVASFGEEDGQTPAAIIESADKRLYNAKENGRNRVN